MALHVIDGEYQGSKLDLKADKVLLSTDKGQYSFSYNSISKVEKVEEISRKVISEMTFTNGKSIKIKSSKSDYSKLYEKQFTNPKKPFELSKVKFPWVIILLLITLGIMGLHHMMSQSLEKPNECDYMNEYDLFAHNYRNRGGDDFICLADYKNFNKSEGLEENSFDYAVEGTSAGINNIYLRLILNKKKDAQEATAEYVKMVNNLLLKVTEKESPKELVKAISKGKEYQGKLNGYEIRLEKNIHNNYKSKNLYGYDLVLYISGFENNLKSSEK